MQPNEICLISRPAKESPLSSVAWYYPNTYAVGMSGLGYQLVWSLLESDCDMLVKRGFTDQEEPGSSACELQGFTVSWELDIGNILTILEKNGVPIAAADRSDADPFVFGGGPVLTANPEPFAEFFDIILTGDAEVMVPAFLKRWKEVRHIDDRKTRLLRLAEVSGIYVPSLYKIEYEPGAQIKSICTISDGVPERVEKQSFNGPPGYAAHTVILSDDTAWGDRFLIEVVRSCPQECRFCLASFLTRPFRAASVEGLMEKIELGLQHTKKIGLLGPSVTEHPAFEELAQRLIARGGIDISVASIRADTISRPVLEMLHGLGQRSVTIAIESGSERLRAIMKKNLSEEEIDEAVRLIEESGMTGLKFYGIVGLPHERQEDLDETVRLMLKLKKRHKRLKLVLGVSSFVPKAQTPFQWHGRDRKAKEKLEYLRKNLSRAGIEVRPESSNWSDIQAVLARGDRRLSEAIVAAWRQGGNLGAWKRALRAQKSEKPGLDFYAFREIPEEGEILPWEHLTARQRSQYLAKHRSEAEKLAAAGNS